MIFGNLAHLPAIILPFDAYRDFVQFRYLSQDIDFAKTSIITLETNFLNIKVVVLTYYIYAATFAISISVRGTFSSYQNQTKLILTLNFDLSHRIEKIGF
jgi:hypothetical protein